MTLGTIHTEYHRTDFKLAEVILGGQDGLVNVLGVILGVAAASQNRDLVVAAGLAATFAESISMAAVAYTSSVAQADHYQSELEREKREMREVPEIEREEIREIYRNKGFEGDLLEQIVQKITSDDRIWLDTMMREELELKPRDRRGSLRSGLIVGISAIIGSFIPLLPFFFLSIRQSIWPSLGLSALALFIVGVYKAQHTIGKPLRTGIEMLAIGIVSALAGYVVGLIFKVNGAIT